MLSRFLMPELLKIPCRTAGVSAYALLIAVILAVMNTVTGCHNENNVTDLTGCWTSGDNCYPELPYTLFIEQNGDEVRLEASVGTPQLCVGELIGTQIEFQCTDNQEKGFQYRLKASVISPAEMCITSDSESSNPFTCTFIKHGGLDPRVERMLFFINRAEAQQPLGQRTPEQMRRFMAESSFWASLYPASDVAEIKNIGIPGTEGMLNLRMYVPHGSAPFPVILFYHGGGFVVGIAQQFDNYSRMLAHKAGALVFSLDYRLAPEHTFPAAHDDAWTAIRWVAENARDFGGDPARLTVAGESAGANLAIYVCTRALEEGGPDIGFQLLMSPITDLLSMDTDTYQRYASGYMLTKEWMEAFRYYYLPVSRDWYDRRVSPLLYPPRSDLPPALIVTAQYDVLRDEGEAYARQLADAGVPVKHYRCAGVIHGFTTALIDLLDQAQKVLDLAIKELETFKDT